MKAYSMDSREIEILVVEDSAVQLQLLVHTLTQKGYKVSAAKNGADALTMIRQKKPTLIISDILMPIMDGYEMCYQIKHDHILKDIPVVLLTQLSDPQDVIRGINARADFYITKPSNNDFDFLLAKIEDLLLTLEIQNIANRDWQGGINIYLDGKTHLINNSNLQQILNLMISIYDNAVQQHVELERRTQQLRESEERYRTVLENTFSGFYRATPSGRFQDVNPAYMSIFGYEDKEELLDVDIPSALYRSQEEYEKFVEDLKSEGPLKNYIKYMRKKDGGEVIVEENIHLVPDYDGSVLYFEGFVNDITERVDAELKIKHQALHDALTDLPNRAFFTNRLAVELANRRSQRDLVGVMFLDLDGFKVVNDTLGHDVGDLLLKAVAEALRKCVRKSDTVARMGGDEFTILLPGITEANNADMIAEKIIESLNRTWKFGNKECRATSSIGISLYPFDGKDPDTLLKNADVAMYYAKTHGKNGYKRYHPSLRAR